MVPCTSPQERKGGERKGEEGRGGEKRRGEKMEKIEKYLHFRFPFFGYSLITFWLKASETFISTPVFHIIVAFMSKTTKIIGR